MLKLMKYEFRKMRTTLLILLGVLAVLEIGFIAGTHMERPTLTAVSIALLTALVFAAYAYILVAGVVSYSRELKDKSGYLIFLAPVRPISVVLSKLLFTALAALAATAVFGLAAYLDYRHLLGRMDIDPVTIRQIDLMLRLGLSPGAGLTQILRIAGFTGLTLLIQVMLTMCTAYLAITLSATLLQNKKGFLRALISVALFVALTWISAWLTQKLFYDRISGAYSTLRELGGVLGWVLLLNLALCAAFAAASAWLLDRKVNL